MKRVVANSLLAVLLLGASSLMAAEQTVKLSVPGMFCASCPYIVKKAISAVKGVQSVKTKVKDRTAMVNFDDKLTTVAVIRKATKDVGYPASVIE